MRKILVLTSFALLAAPLAAVQTPATGVGAAKATQSKESPPPQRALTPLEKSLQEAVKLVDGAPRRGGDRQAQGDPEGPRRDAPHALPGRRPLRAARQAAGGPGGAQAAGRPGGRRARGALQRRPGGAAGRPGGRRPGLPHALGDQGARLAGGARARHADGAAGARGGGLLDAPPVGAAQPLGRRGAAGGRPTSPSSSSAPTTPSSSSPACPRAIRPSGSCAARRWC